MYDNNKVYFIISIFYHRRPEMENQSKKKYSIKKKQENSQTLELKKNPLKEFFKKPHHFQFKTMSQLNMYLNMSNLQVEKENHPPLQRGTNIIDEKEIYMELESNDPQGRQLLKKKSTNFSGESQGEKHVLQVSSRKDQKRFEYQNQKIKMHELIDINQTDINLQYQFKEKIGEGAFGQVFKLKNKETGEIRAVKVIKKRMMNEKQTKEFLNETSLLKRISHPSIIRIYDIYQYDNHFYVVMEYCKGGSVYDCLEKIPKKSQEIVAGIMKQVIEALSYIHSLNIIHRDLKVQNIVFVNEVNSQTVNNFLPIKIIDFGIALQLGIKVDHSKSVAGTVEYMAPEVFKGILTQKSDIWSCGIIIIKMLTRWHPLEVLNNDKETIKNIQNKQLDFYEKPFSLISDEARDLLQKMLQKNFHKRPSASEILKHPWFTSIQKRNSTNFRMIKQLEKYQRKDNLESIIECYLTLKKSSQEERQNLASIFSSLDKDNSGQVDKKEFMQIFQKYSPQMSQEQLNNLIDLIDKDKSGKIDFNQFLVAMSKRDKIFIKESIGEAFDHFDKDKTGFLEKKELRSILRHCPREEIQFFIQKLDTNKDNLISKQQFIQYLVHP